MTAALTGSLGLHPGQAALLKAERQHAEGVRRDRFGLKGGRILILVLVVAAWQLLSGLLLDPFFFSRPSEILQALTNLVTSGKFSIHVGLTVEEAVFGYIAGALAGVVAAALLGLLPRAYAVTEPFVLAVYSVPSVAIGPLLIVWFGIGLQPKVLLAAYFVFFVVFMNGIAGVRSVPRGWLDAARVMGAGRLQLVTKVILRGAAPHLMVGLRTALPQAVIGAVVAEFISSQRGIGFLITDASSHYNTAGVFASILILSLLVLLMAVLLGANSARRLIRRA
jgi:NitT/TauT family transport system permease protein